MYTLTLWYECVPCEEDLPDFSLPPMTPAQRDDWVMFKKIEDEEFAKCCTEERYKAWQTKETQEKDEVEEWLRIEESKKSVEA